MKFCAHLYFLYLDLPFLDRFAAAAEDGFGGVECLDPYNNTKEEIWSALKASGLKQVLFNMPAGNWNAGERGIACLPNRIEEFREGVGLALDYAKSLECSQLNVMCGSVPPGADLKLLEATLVDNLRYASANIAMAHSMS